MYIDKLLDDVLDFGKYRSKTYREVCYENPYYIQWVSENNVRKLSEEILELSFEVICVKERGVDPLSYDWQDGHPLDYGDS